MSELNYITKKELCEIIKKRKLSEEEKDINNSIIENEAEKFIELFEKLFSEERTEETTEEKLDSEDCVVKDLFDRIISKIKEKLVKSARANTAKVLKLMFSFIEKIVEKKNGEDKSSSAAEACKH